MPIVWIVSQGSPAVARELKASVAASDKRAECRIAVVVKWLAVGSYLDWPMKKWNHQSLPESLFNGGVEAFGRWGCYLCFEIGCEKTWE